MKITLSKTELLTIISAQLGYSVTDLTISKDNPLHLTIKKAVAKDLGVTGNLDSFLVNRGENKIPAIKSLRTHIPGMGLFDAKWAIENWSEWIAFVQVNGRFPKLAVTQEASYTSVKLS